MFPGFLSILCKGLHLFKPGNALCGGFRGRLPQQILVYVCSKQSAKHIKTRFSHRKNLSTGMAVGRERPSEVTTSATAPEPETAMASLSHFGGPLYGALAEGALMHPS